MPTRHLVLIGAVVIAFLAFVGFGIVSPNWSVVDVLTSAVFALFFVLIVFLALRKVSDPVEGYRGFPRGYWVVFASIGGAFALMLFASAVAPWLGLENFSPLHDRQYWWVLPVIAALIYPVVNRNLR